MLPSIRCPVCRGEAYGAVAVCQACETPHHPDCWEWAKGCSVFACGSARARLLEAAAFLIDLEVAGALEIDDTAPEPPRRYGPPPAERRRESRRESAAIMVVSWVYLAASLGAAVPAAGYAMGGVARGSPEALLSGLATGGVALALKVLGDQLAVGDPRARRAHLTLCLVLGLVSVSPFITAALLPLALPFWSRRGRAHFGSFPA